MIDYLRTGVRAGMSVPDATDQSIDTLRVVRDNERVVREKE